MRILRCVALTFLAGAVLGLCEITPTLARAATVALQQDPVLHNARVAGYNAGYRDGHADAGARQAYDFHHHLPYQSANGWSSDMSVQQEAWQTAFRTGYEAGYDDGFYGRAQEPEAQPDRHYHPEMTATPPPAPDAYVGTVPAGARLRLRINDTLSVRSSRPGDSFSATVVDPVLARDGRQVLIPPGSSVEGNVVSIQRGGATQMQLSFNHIHLPDGQSAEMAADLSGVSPRSGAAPNGEGGVESTAPSKAGSVAAGGIFGTVLGAMVGGGKGAIIGGTAGAGMGLALSSHNGDLVLPAGTAMVVTLAQPLHIH